MEIPEQYPPNKPNFKLIVVLFCVTILVVLAAAVVVMYVRDKDSSRHPSSTHVSFNVRREAHQQKQSLEDTAAC